MNDLSRNNNIGKTPMQVAVGKIKEAYIMAFVSSGLMLVLAVLSFLDVISIDGINIFSLIDVILVAILAVLIATKKAGQQQ